MQKKKRRKVKEVNARLIFDDDKEGMKNEKNMSSKRGFFFTHILLL